MSYMKTYQIDKDVVQDFEKIKPVTNKLLGITNTEEWSVGYNNLLLLQKIKEIKSGVFVQCGVFKGWTLVPALLYCEKYNYDIEFHGFDTFGGFPSDVISNPKDEPIQFIDLFENGTINQEHFDKAKERTNNFKGINHLSEEYFSDIGNVLTFESHFSGSFVKYHKGTFSNTTKNFNKEIDILHLDCDLYQSYLDVLNGLYKNVKQGGSIIFDEYYSLKYPGARIAVNEFFSSQPINRFEKYITQDSFERWCVVK